MNKLKTRILAMLLAVMMVVSIMPSDMYAAELATEAVSETAQVLATQAADVDYDNEYVVLSLEGLTIGQGFYLLPEKLSYTQIVQVWQEEGVTIDPAELTASEATYAFFKKAGIETNVASNGYHSSSFYMQSVKDVDKGTVSIPQVILDGSGKSQEELTENGNTDKDLDAFDYNFMTGWMFTVNNVMANVGAGSYVMSDNITDSHVQTIRWQFTIDGYGADLGFGWGSSYYTSYDKTELYSLYADAASVIDNYPVEKAEILTVMEKVNASEEEIAAAEGKLKDVLTAAYKTVTVNIYDYTAVAAGLTQASTDGVILETTVTVANAATVEEVIKKACEEHGISYTLTPSYYGGSYVSMMNGLSENDGDQYSGWMVNYNNDDFTNMGLSALTIKSGDVLEFHYSNNGLGTDIASGYSLPLLKTLKVGSNSYTFGSETTYDEQWNATTTYTIDDGSGVQTLTGAGTQENPFVIPVGIAPNTDVTRLTASAVMVADSHYASITGLAEVIDLTKPVDVTVTSNGGNTAHYRLVKEDTYKVSFNSNNKNATGSMTEMALTVDTAKNLTANAYKLTGYTFAGWATSAGGAVVYKDQESVKNIAAVGKTITLYAVWTPITYQVAFYDNSKNATGKMTALTLTYDKAQKLTASKFKRKGYDFTGWATSAKGKVVYKNAASIKNLTATAGTTVKLYAKWSKTTVKTATISSVKSSKTKTMTIKWKKVSQADGYAISYSTDKSMKKSVKTIYVTKGSTTSKTIKKLKAGKKYYVTVKAYEKDSAGKRVLGACKAKKAVTIKK